ncbi:hypothetical protein LguiA_004381 [Lonicera macranthoides]
MMMAFHAIPVQLVTLVAVILLATKLSTAAIQPRPDCPTTCGNLTNITFPFGTSSDCYLDETFLITCNTMTNKALLRRGSIEVQSISLDGQMRVSAFVARACFNESGGRINNSINSVLGLSSFSVSNTRNWFTVVGCATLALIQGSSVEQNYTTGCASLCDSPASVINGSCSGIGCCQSTIPEGVAEFTAAVQNLGNYSRVVGFNPCSYAFVVERDEYVFSSADLMDLQGRQTVPVVLDWAVGKLTCQEAQRNLTSYACRDVNSECVDSNSRGGYKCNCSSGFEGNPYLLGGCQDINECEISNPCENGYECVNSAGNYTCSCPEGHEDDGTSCRKKEAKGPPVLHIALGISLGLLVLLVGGTWVFWLSHKRKLIKQREQFFHQNGGFILKQQLSEHQGSSQTAKIFTAEDLKKATNNYDESRVIGQGGYGTVYKGILPDNREVAIKKSKISDQSQIEQFINEVVILSQINHRNVLKLLGCCLETEVPLLVYEFITNGTLSDHIHNENRALSLSWEMRLKVAVEAAGAIAYLHSETSTPIIHRDIKSTNILLDENYTTKVSDFGASRLVPLNQSQLTTLVQGTFGYLDPEYFHSSQLTEKSDVYSFGVLLAELLTGEMVLSFDRAENDRNLAMYFISSVKEGRLVEILDDRMVKEGNFDQLNEVATLVKRCLRVKGEERPTMREVSMELEGLRMMGKHPWVEKELNAEESEHLLNQVVPSDSYKGFLGGDSSTGTTIGYDSMRDQVIMPLEFR